MPWFAHSHTHKPQTPRPPAPPPTRDSRGAAVQLKPPQPKRHALARPRATPPFGTAGSSGARRAALSERRHAALAFPSGAQQSPSVAQCAAPPPPRRACHRRPSERAPAAAASAAARNGLAATYHAGSGTAPTPSPLSTSRSTPKWSTRQERARAVPVSAAATESSAATCDREAAFPFPAPARSSSSSDETLVAGAERRKANARPSRRRRLPWTPTRGLTQVTTE
mmetsp:Transcript_36794/g.119019  ORF Transcript_36794/g.119019 Transcript_36794/m.119019 type:complete len:225 (-) Transcript_36794:561-1235(-)